jgi:hypothetical protein
VFLLLLLPYRSQRHVTIGEVDARIAPTGSPQGVLLYPEWKSHIFNFGRNEVRSSLLSSGLFWLNLKPRKRRSEPVSRIRYCFWTTSYPDGDGVRLINVRRNCRIGHGAGESAKHQLHAAGHPDLVEHPEQIVLDGVLAELQLGGNFAVAQAVGNQLHHACSRGVSNLQQLSDSDRAGVVWTKVSSSLFQLLGYGSE